MIMCKTIKIYILCIYLNYFIVIYLATQSLGETFKRRNRLRGEQMISHRALLSCSVLNRVCVRGGKGGGVKGEGLKGEGLKGRG